MKKAATNGNKIYSGTISDSSSSNSKSVHGGASSDVSAVSKHVNADTEDVGAIDLNGEIDKLGE